MTDETLTKTLSNLRDDIDMLLNAHYSSSPDGIAGMKTRIASAIANIDTLTSNLNETNALVAQNQQNIEKHNTMLQAVNQFMLPMINNNSDLIQETRDNFIAFLERFMTQTEQGSNVELSDKVEVWSPYLKQLRKILDILSVQDAQDLKNMLSGGDTGGSTVSTELQEQVETNTTNIAKLQSKVSTNTSNLGTLQTQVDTNTANITNLQTQANTFSTNIASMQMQLDANTADIENLKSQAGGSNPNIESLQTQVDTNTTNITTLQGKVTTLEAQVAKYLTPPDPYYTGKTFTDYPAGTIWQTYDYDERLLDLSSATLITAPKIYFTAEAGSAGKIKLTFSLSSTGAVTGIVKTYLNGTLLDTRNVDMQENQAHNISFELFDCPLNTESQANDIYTTFSYTSSGKTLHLTNQKVEITASNAQCINKLCPFNAFYFNGYYYLTDCSTGSLKTAQILATDMHNMDNLTWTDTGMPAVECAMAGTFVRNSDATRTPDKMYYFRHAPNENYYVGEINDITKELTYLNTLDTTAVKATYLSYLSKRTNVDKTYYSFYYVADKRQADLVFVTPDTDASAYCCAKFYDPRYIDFDSLCIRQDGSAHNTLGDLNARIRFDVMSGVNSTLIITSAKSTSNCVANFYTKNKDKLIKQTIKRTDSYVFEILSTIEFGLYDKLFEMPNNDYFAVKNNKLYYYKNSN